MFFIVIENNQPSNFFTDILELMWKMWKEIVHQVVIDLCQPPFLLTKSFSQQQQTVWVPLGTTVTIDRVVQKHGE